MEDLSVSSGEPPAPTHATTHRLLASAAQTPQLQYLLAMVAMLSGTSALLFFASVLASRLRHERVSLAATIAALSLAWYCVSMSLTLFNRLILGYMTGFSWPVTMSLSHMAVKGCLALVGIILTASARGVEDLPPLRRTLAMLTSVVKSQDISAPVFWRVLVPLGAATAIDVVLSALAMSFIDVSVYTVAKSTALVFTLMFSMAAGLQRLNGPVLLAVGAVSVGVVLCSMRPAAVDPRGVACAVTAAACGAARWVLTERYFSRKGIPSHPLLLIALLSPITVLTLLPALAWEAPRMVAAHAALTSPADALLVVGMMLGGGVLAFLLLLVELQLVRMTSSLTLNVIGHAKDLFVIGLAVPVFGETLTPLNAAGVLLMLVGTTIYTFHKSRRHVQSGQTAHGSAAAGPYSLVADDTAADDGEGGGGPGGDLDEDMEFAILAQQARAGVTSAGDAEASLTRLDLDFDDSGDEWETVAAAKPSQQSQPQQFVREPMALDAAQPEDAASGGGDSAAVRPGRSNSTSLGELGTSAQDVVRVAR